MIKCFNKSTMTYDSAADIQKTVANRLLDSVADMSAQSIVEIGCGTGLLSHLLVREFPHSQLLLTDIASNMVAHCQNRFASYPQIQVKCVDGEKIRLHQKADLIISSMTLHWFTHIKNSFSHIISQLAPKGHFIFAMLGAGSLIEWRALCQEYHLPIAMPCFVEPQQLVNHFPKMEIKKEIIKFSHSTSYDFLKTLKKIGATAHAENYQPVTVRQLRSVLRQAQQPFEVSYEVMYGRFRK